jgi:hypothetical protein
VLKDSEEILKRYPAHVLASSAEHAPRAKFKNWEHLFESAAGGVENGADPNVNQSC